MKRYSFIALLCVIFSCFSMQRECSIARYVYRYAQDSDIPALLKCIEMAERSPDKDNLVILPRKFREHALQKTIAARRLFVAYDNEHLMGYKKLYQVPCEELEELLHDEIRCMDAVSVEGDSAHTIERSHCYFYTGADYTVPEYRRDGVKYPGFSVNSQLIQHALRVTCASIQQAVTFVFGVTQENAGDSLLCAYKRPQSIIGSLSTFLETIRMQKPQLVVSRYYAEKPTFDADSQECIPLKQGVLGFGYVVKELL